ncbi:MAG: efflux RND transporter periplasmic adaptor subunit [Pantoea sp.]|uniref:efflux RND transporter periplasmic adaptor subunit n=1 Tax=Pantoea sp. TaxID=69393 RepID=UPI0023A42046|nr:efflux RND transporter periplasmic adaptor subunit [Pantoea sp.]MDE1188017.1 efflux RND transporter periplasmic adaptor subunit [Pantoea sp.]
MDLRHKGTLLLIAGLVIGCGSWYFWPRQQADAAMKPAHSAPLVSMVTAMVKPLPITLTTQGHIIALNQVDIQAQITGTVKTVAFHEGDFVKAGQLLFTLDNASQSAAYDRAVAALGESKALLVKAQNDLQRGRALKAKNYISMSDWDTLQSNVQQYQAQYKAAQQDVQTADVTLGYTRIVAPVNGKTGALNVHPGSLVQPGSTLPLVSLMQFDPIGVSFTLPEKDLKPVLTAQAKGPVTVWVENASGTPTAGKLDFIDNSVSTASGTITLKAQFSNSNTLLWPGLFQNVKVDAGVTPDAVVLPPQAVQNGPDGHFVYVVDKHNQAAVKPVTLLRIQQSLAVVTGISQGTKVVNEGANNLRPGITVQIASNIDKAMMQP